MRCRFAFSQTSDGRLLVIMEALWGFSSGLNGKFFVSAIDDENTFIQHVVLASLDKDETVDLIAGVLLVVAGRQTADRWVSATLNHIQLTALGMDMGAEESPEPKPEYALGFADAEDLARVFMQAPAPVMMMAGPDHIITFANPAYLKMVGRKAEDVLRKPLREAMPELEGQPFFGLLDNVYRTGEPFVGHEMKATIYHDDLRTTREAYFDFVYHPVRDRDDQVCGILNQVTEVTEQVLEKHVRESREEQLYRQWAELDAIYRTSPAGMCLIAAKDYSILRVNEIKAKLLGAPVDELIGKKMTDIFPEHTFIPDSYREVVATKSAMSFELSAAAPGDPGKIRSWLWNLNPVLGSSGEVESIASVVIETTERPVVIKAFLDSEAAPIQ